MPIPWSPYDGPPWTYVETWPFAMLLANWRAESHQIKQRVSWDESQNQWKVEDR